MRIIHLIFLFLFSATELFPVDIFTLERKNNLGKKMENEIFVKWIWSFDFDDFYLYIIDNKYGTILKVDLQTGKLIQTISSKGQGPGELEKPVHIEEKGNKLYVLDTAWGGIKIFDKSGKYLSSFHTILPFIPVMPFLGSQIFTVNERGEVFVAAPDFKEDTLVTVYDERTGKKIRSLIKEDLEKIKDRKEFVINNIYKVRVDKENNLYILYPLKKRIKKYRKDGKLLWDKSIEDKVLKKEIKRYGKEEIVVKKGSIQIRNREIAGFEVSENGTVFIFHSNAISVFDKNGDLFSILKNSFSPARIKNGMVVCVHPVFTQGSFIEELPIKIRSIL